MPSGLCSWRLPWAVQPLCLSGESFCTVASVYDYVPSLSFGVSGCSQPVFKFSSFSPPLWNDFFSNVAWSMYSNKQKHVLCLVPQRRKVFPVAQNQPKFFMRAHLTFTESPPSLAPFPCSLWASCSIYGWPELSLAQSTVCCQHHCCLRIYKVCFQMPLRQTKTCVHAASVLTAANPKSQCEQPMRC